MTPNWHLHRQRDRARDRFRSCHRSPGVFSKPPTIAPTSWVRSFLIAARGWSSKYDQKNTLYVRIEPQAQVPGNHLPARSGPALRRGNPQDLLHRRPHAPSPTANCSGKFLRTPPKARTLWCEARARRSAWQGRDRAFRPQDYSSCGSRLCAPPASARWKWKPAELDGALPHLDVVDTTTGEVIVEANFGADGPTACTRSWPPAPQVSRSSSRPRRRGQYHFEHFEARLRAQAGKALIEIYASCARAIRPRSTPRPRSSKACSSIRASTTSRA